MTDVGEIMIREKVEKGWWEKSFIRMDLPQRKFMKIVRKLRCALMKMKLAVYSFRIRATTRPPVPKIGPLCFMNLRLFFYFLKKSFIGRI
jgi:hypothetical protein